MRPADQNPSASALNGAPYPDLTVCEREPIHIPGSIQPHGILLVLREPELTIEQASANAGHLLGIQLESLTGEALAHRLRDAGQSDPEYLGQMEIDGQRFDAVGHRFAGRLILELETLNSAVPSVANLNAQLRGFLAGMERAATAEDVCALAVQQVRRVTGFDRVLVYRFDPSWHGRVVAEDRAQDLDSYLDHWFPAADIPPQARELYRTNRIRLIADATYSPVPILSHTAGPPLDLSYAILRSVSPVHLEYLKNMGVLASMSISLLRDGQLWGLIACHHRTPLRVPFEVRSVCEFIGQFLSDQVGMRERAQDYERRIAVQSVQSRLVLAMAQTDDFVEGLTQAEDDLLRFVDARGAALLHNGECQLIGATPAEADVRNLATWILDRGETAVFSTNAIVSLISSMPSLQEVASGVLAIPVSKLSGSCVIWFRPEKIKTLAWRGDKEKPVEEHQGRIHPRKSFETWRETVRGEADPWSASEIEAAARLRNAIVEVVLRKAETLARLTQELQRSNKELESFSYSVSHDLRAPFRHIVGYAELLRDSKTAILAPEDSRYLKVITDAALFAGDLVDNLLSYSRIGRVRLRWNVVNMNELAQEVMRQAQEETVGRNISWTVSDLPAVNGDSTLLRVVWQNLIGNAVKYTRRRDPARIEIGVNPLADEVRFYVRDNGAGFDPRYQDKLFGVFQRLHAIEDFEGTGIGLANVRRIVARHGGRAWAEGAVNEGATLYFSIPKKRKDTEEI